jgi:hypothetical protein
MWIWISLIIILVIILETIANRISKSDDEKRKANYISLLKRKREYDKWEK